MDWETWAQSQVELYQTLKMVLNTSLLNTQQNKVRIKGKVEQSWGTSEFDSHWVLHSCGLVLHLSNCLVNYYWPFLLSTESFSKFSLPYSLFPLTLVPFPLLILSHSFLSLKMFITQKVFEFGVGVGQSGWAIFRIRIFLFSKFVLGKNILPMNHYRWYL